MEQKSNITVTNVDHFFCDIMHSNISIETGIAQCADGKEVGELIRLLAASGMLDERSYDELMAHMAQKGLLDKFVDNK